MAMLEPGDILIDCTGSRSLLRDHLVPGAGDGRRRANTLNDPARVRARHHVPVRPAVRLQRVLQVLQEPREPAVQVHPDGAPHALRRQRQPRHGHRQHLRRRVRGDADPVRRPVAARQLPRGRGVDGPVHRQDQGGDAGRDPRRARDRADPPRPLPGAQCDEPAGGSLRGRTTTRSPAHRCSSRATRRSARRTSSRSRSASSARCSSRGSSRSATYPRGDARSLRALQLQAVAPGLHAQQDDQAQQGSASSRSTTRSRSWRSSTSTERSPVAARRPRPRRRSARRSTLRRTDARSVRARRDGSA